MDNTSSSSASSTRGRMDEWVWVVKVANWIGRLGGRGQRVTCDGVDQKKSLVCVRADLKIEYLIKSNDVTGVMGLAGGGQEGIVIE